MFAWETLDEMCITSAFVHLLKDSDLKKNKLQANSETTYWIRH